MKIRWRLTLRFSLILCVILIFSSILIHTLLHRYLSNKIDDNLRVYSAKVHGTLNFESIPEPINYDVIHSNLPPVNEFAFPGTYIQIFDINGSVVVKSDNLGNQQLPVYESLLERAVNGKIGIDTFVAENGVRVRMLISPLFMQNQTVFLEVGQSLEPLETSMSQVRWSLLAGSLVALLLTGVLGSIFVRRALYPVEHITEIASDIGKSSDLSRRVGYDGPMDEIGQLAATFDHMIERLDMAFESQKQFIADASHELRSPLTVLQGNLDLFKRNLGEEDRQDSLKIMGKEVIGMSGIINDLLLLAEVESGLSEQQEMVSLKEILNEGLSRGQQLAGKRKVLIDIQEDLFIKGNALRLKQLLVNLVNNAITYTPESGKITLSLIRNDHWACIKVTDTGIGIATEHQAHIFDRFYRVDKARSRSKGGTGLGLAIAKGIAEQHGGKLTVSSELGRGSTFTAWLKF